jgi:hypothetical protein
MSEYHIGIRTGKGLLAFGKLYYKATARNSASSSLAAKE